MSGGSEVVEGELLPECAQRGCVTIARPGQVLCDEHAVPQLLAAAKRKLAAAAPAAAEELIRISQTADSADVRRRASEAVLDRAGVRSGVEVDLLVDSGVSPADLLRERLATLRRRTLEGASEGVPLTGSSGE